MLFKNLFQTSMSKWHHGLVNHFLSTFVIVWPCRNFILENLLVVYAQCFSPRHLKCFMFQQPTDATSKEDLYSMLLSRNIQVKRLEVKLAGMFLYKKVEFV